MSTEFAWIRSIIGDSRIISRNTDMPQYKIQELKSKLFMVANSQNKAVCDWWLRLYHGEYSKKDLSILRLAIENDFDVAEQLEQ